ncbi:hypothetical protein GQ600_25645 [Phytophthora cactorum]|nr:hypothetical protein GQ600_25645 [Phytophthora cactorum]
MEIGSGAGWHCGCVYPGVRGDYRPHLGYDRDERHVDRCAWILGGSEAGGGQEAAVVYSHSIKDPTNRQRRVTGTWMDLSLCGVCKDKLRRHSRGRDGFLARTKVCSLWCTAVLEMPSSDHSRSSLVEAKASDKKRANVVVSRIAWQQNQQRAASDDADQTHDRGLLDDDAFLVSRTILFHLRGFI